jgi:ADP-ribosylglycohydrolase
MLEIIQGSLLGCAIGDALGWPVEFDKKNLPVKDLPTKPLYTDDTQMTIAVARGLLAFETDNEEMDLAVTPSDHVRRELINWLHDPETPGRAPGSSCLHGCRQLELGVEWNRAGKEDSTGCGAVMRSAPYGWFYHRQPERARTLAGLHALMTHRSKEAQGSSAALAAGVSACFGDLSPEDVAEHMHAAARHFDRHTATMIDCARRYVRWGVSPKNVLDQFRGWQGQEAIAAAVFCFLTAPDSYEDAVLLAVNSPGDSDSLGAITGALSGAYLGLSCVNAEWIARIEKRDMLLELGAQIHEVVRTGHERNHEPGSETERERGPSSAGAVGTSAAPHSGGGAPSTAAGASKPRGKIQLRSSSRAPSGNKPR